jgi:hypothetical protein
VLQASGPIWEGCMGGVEALRMDTTPDMGMGFPRGCTMQQLYRVDLAAPDPVMLSHAALSSAGLDRFEHVSKSSSCSQCSHAGCIPASSSVILQVIPCIVHLCALSHKKHCSVGAHAQVHTSSTQAAHSVLSTTRPDSTLAGHPSAPHDAAAADTNHTHHQVDTSASAVRQPESIAPHAGMSKASIAAWAGAAGVPIDVSAVMHTPVYSQKYMESIRPVHIPPKEVREAFNCGCVCQQVHGCEELPEVLFS